jgi:hypothetical protein
MKLVLWNIVIICAFLVSSFAQEVPQDSVPQASEMRTTNNNIFVEVLGNAWLYSINYERIIANYFVIRGGLSFLPVRSDIQPRYFTLLPVSASYLIGSTHYCELGIGTMFASFNGTDARWNLFSEKQGLNTFVEVSGTPKFAFVPFATITPIIGYRWHPTDGSINFRVVFTPMISLTPYFITPIEFTPFGGVSIGWSF